MLKATGVLQQNRQLKAILGLRTSRVRLLPGLWMYLDDFGRIADTRVLLEADADVEALGLRVSLETMRERAEAIGGRFAIVSGDDGGTKVTVQVPLGRKGTPADARALG